MLGGFSPEAAPPRAPEVPPARVPAGTGSADAKSRVAPSERARLVYHGLINSSGLVISGLVGVLLVPVMLGGLGAEQYGLLVAALALAGAVRAVDFGIGYAVVREVARGGLEREGSAAFLSAAAGGYVALGFAGAFIVGATGLALSGNKGLQISGAPPCHVVFALVGLTLVADQALAFVLSVLSGLERFPLVNALLLAAAVARAAGILVILHSHRGLVEVIACQGIAVAGTAVVGLRLLSAPKRHVRLCIPRLDWRSVRPHLEFGMASLLVGMFGKVIWEAGPVLVGLTLGPAAVVPYYVGQKFPVALSTVTWRATEVLFPAAGRADKAGDRPYLRELLQFGTRWIVVLAVPSCLVLFILAPEVLRVWLGQVPAGAVTVMRLLIGAVFADAIGASALTILWGSGKTRSVVFVLAGIALTAVGLGGYFSVRLGVPGIALGVFSAVLLGSVVLVVLASRACGASAFTLSRMIAKTAWAPTLACGLTTFSAASIFCRERWYDVVAAGAIGGATYLLGLHLQGLRENE